MTVYVVTSFKKDAKTGYSLPNGLEVYATREAAEKAAEKLDCFTTVTAKKVKS